MAGHGVTPDVPADDAGPFSLHDPAAVDELLTGAGWSDVHVADARRLAARSAAACRRRTTAVAALDFGPTRIVTTGIADDVAESVVDAIAEAFAPLDRGDGVVLGGRIRIVRARRT